MREIDVATRPRTPSGKMVRSDGTFLWATYEMNHSTNTSGRAAATLVMQSNTEPPAHTPSTAQVKESSIRTRPTATPSGSATKPALAQVADNIQNKPNVDILSDSRETVKRKAGKFPITPTKSPATRIRPSLSDQLASIANNSSTLIEGMKQSIIPSGGDSKGKPTLLVYCSKFSVGRCESMYSSAVQFFPTRCSYAFHHPIEKRVEMDMNYKDMASVTVSDSARTFTFRILRPLGKISNRVASPWVLKNMRARDYLHCP
mmetsp:Transcript_47850/g.126931  ORF Transcript_47850/g.126931 Transcript_47850/m.126931 type:complete len:260 (+) Transcript_47850:19-798(+)